MPPVALPNLGAEEPEAPSAATRSALLPLAELFRAQIERDVPIFEWLPRANECVAWLNSESAESRARELRRPLFGATARVVARCHDKAFAQWVAARESLVPAPLRGLCRAFAPADLAPGAAESRALDVLAGLLRDCPSELGLTLKPRMGTSGRGRVAVRSEADLTTARAAFARFRSTGGCLAEPWLHRMRDLSAVLFVSPAREVTLIGSAELLVTASGVYRGHRGQLDARGRMSSGLPFDEALREAAVALAVNAAREGYTGVCGVDGLVFEHEERSLLRPVVEFNARFTVGFVVAAALRESLHRIREQSSLRPDHAVWFEFEPAPRQAAPLPEAVLSLDLGVAEATPRPPDESACVRTPRILISDDPGLLANGDPLAAGE